MLTSLLKHAIASREEKLAIVADDGAITFAVLLARIEKLAAVLREHLHPAAVLGLHIAHPADFVTANLAAATSGYKLVLLDPRSTREELGREAVAFSVTHILSRLPHEQLPDLAVLSETMLLLEGRPFRLIRLDADTSVRCYRQDDFVVHCTSGTTGRPKGIVMSAGNVRARIVNWSSTLSLTPSDVVLCTLSLAHCHGIDILMLPGLMNGCTVVAPDLDRISPRRICSLIAEHGITIFSSLPYMYDMILESVPVQKARLETLRYMISGSAPLSKATSVAFRDKFGRGINQVYGLSEIGAICFNKDPDRIGSIGEFIDGVEGVLTDYDGDGEGRMLIVRGDALARGYYNSPEAEQEMFRDGWLWTQDIVRQDEDGVHIVGRRSRFINSGGNKINPLEVEDALRLHPGVAEVIVAGVEDALRTERIVAFVKAAASLDPSILSTFLASRIAAYKMPDEYVFIEHIPRNGIGKIQLAELVADWARPVDSKLRGGRP
jgi:acyl-CoA synthetase (AMP-forming)/AMP-acid ligase II